MTAQLTAVSEATGTLTPSGAGVMRIQIIDAGSGASGVYPAQTLEAAADDRIFHKGLHVHFDHPTLSETTERPERSVLTLAGSLASDAAWNADTKALEADFKPYASVYDSIKERAADIGLSIRASAEVEDDGTVARIVSAESVDLVTKAGRGGRILDVIESARRDIAERNGLDYQPRHVAEPPQPAAPAFETEDTVTLHWDGQKVTEAHERAEAEWLEGGANTRPEPDTRSTATAVETRSTAATAGGNMVDIQESELNQLRESAGRVEALEAERDQAHAELAEARAENTRVTAESIVNEAFTGIEAPKAKARLVEAAVAADEFDADAFKAEVEESAAEFTPTGPTVEGFGDTTAVQEAETVSDEDIVTTLKGAR